MLNPRKLFFLFIFSVAQFLQANEAILLMGPPGSGKGTFSSFAKSVGYGHVSAGDVIREEILSGTELGLELNNIVGRGDYVGPQTLFRLVAGRIEAFLQKKTPVIIDGYGRTREDWDRLSALLKKMGIKRRVILFEASQKVCLERILGRLICVECGYITSKHIGHREGAVCPNCLTTQLSLRMNDNLEVTLKRLNTYHHEIKPLLLETFKGENITVFDSDLPLESLEKEFQKLLFSR
ncbi:MAG: nucleoside monophosphate kinase [Chlamydiae bacterium]|nr:nucleoside monophosphate kinase [Chlamydiota bacterium]